MRKLNNVEQSSKVTLEVNRDVLFNLLKHKKLSLNDFRCHDKETKRFVWESYLHTLRNS